MSPDSRLLARVGVSLLLVSFVNGFLIHALALPRLALSAHLVGLLGAVFLIALAALWPALTQTPRMSRVGAVLAVYGFGGGWLVYFVAAAAHAGGMSPMASGQARGAAALESIVGLGMLTIAIALGACCGIVLRAARGPAQAPRHWKTLVLMYFNPESTSRVATRAPGPKRRPT